jgi:hypothetical protein
VNTWKVILATMVIFAAGVLTGGVLTWRLQGSHSEPRQRATAARSGQAPSPGGQRLEFLRRAQRELDLNPQQRERLDKILKESQERIRKLMEPLAPEMHQEIERTKQAFRQELTPDQQKKLDELLKKQTHSRDPRRQPAGEARPQ